MIKKNILFFILFSALSFYCVYEQVIDTQGIPLAQQKDRHEKFMAGDSYFFNPWQYRVFSSYLLEGTIRSWNSVKSLFPSALSERSEAEYFPYLILRYLQNVLIFFAALFYYKALRIKNETLVMLGIMILGFCMSNSTYASDLSLNTYFDVFFYLVAGYLIIKGKNIAIIPLTFVAALNRETSAFIPVMMLLFNIDFQNRLVPSKKIITIFLASVGLFIVAYIAPRMYYGIREYHGINGIDTPLEFLRFNLTFGSFFPELFGTLGFLCVIALLKYNHWNRPLRLFFWLIAPFWFAFHLLMSQAMETRLFLVPQALIFIPAVLYVVHFEYRKSRKTVISTTPANEKSKEMPVGKVGQKEKTV